MNLIFQPLKMIYSNFYKKWTATCMRRKLALIKFDNSLNREEIYKKDFYSYQFLKKYFLIDDDMYTVRSDSGYCISKKCRAYMKNQ